MAVELILLSRVAFRDHEITGPRLRGLLVLLASDLRAGCSTARLVDGLWPDEQPENPTKALQVLVSRIRAQLGAGVIASTPTGYRLALDEDRVDACAVQLSASASTQQARAGDHAAALAHAEAGLALWDGVPSDDARLDDPVSLLRSERADVPVARALARWPRPGWAVTTRRSPHSRSLPASTRGTRRSCWSCCAARRRRRAPPRRSWSNAGTRVPAGFSVVSAGIGGQQP